MFKRTIVSMFIMAALSAPLAGDARADEARWDMFISAGWSNSLLNDRDNLVANDQSVNGGTYGVSFQLRIYDEFAIDAGIRYTEKGGSGTIDSTFSVPHFANVTQQIGAATVELNYIEFPLLFAWVIETSYDSYLRAYIGPSVAWLVSSKVTGVTSGQPFESDLDGEVSNAEWCGVVGASFNYNFGGWQALIDYRYVNGISGIENGSPEISLNTQTHEFTLGVGFKLAGY
jgi:hypothetical protein